MLNRALKALLLEAAVPGVAQEKINLSIATGGTGGVYYPFGGGMAWKIEAFFRVGGLPTASVTDLAATPGVKIKMSTTRIWWRR